MSSSEEVDHPVCKIEDSSPEEVTDEQPLQNLEPVSSQVENVVEGANDDQQRSPESQQADVDHPDYKIEDSSPEEVTDEQPLQNLEPLSSQVENVVEGANDDQQRSPESQQDKKVEEMWQLKKTWSEQNLFIFENGVFADCEFVVGAPPSEIKKFHLNRAFLSKASPVFNCMLYGDLAEKKEIYVPDIEPHVFSHLMKFIYCGQLDITTLDLEQVQDLCLAANKYMLISLKNSCVDQLEANIKPATAFKYIQFATLLDLESLKHKARKILLERTDEVITDVSFNDVPQELILEIVQEPKLHIDSEFPLISACMLWATHEVARRDLTTDTDGFKEALDPILNHLRLYSLTIKELAALDNILSHVFSLSERHAMFICIALKKFSDIPKELCQIHTKREKYEIPVPKFLIFAEKCSRILCKNELHVIGVNSYRCKPCDTYGLVLYPYFCSVEMKVDSKIYFQGFTLSDPGYEMKAIVLNQNEVQVPTGNCKLFGSEYLFEKSFLMHENVSYTLILRSPLICVETTKLFNSSSGLNLFLDKSYASNPKSKCTVTQLIYIKA